MFQKFTFGDGALVLSVESAKEDDSVAGNRFLGVVVKMHGAHRVQKRGAVVPLTVVVVVVVVVVVALILGHDHEFFRTRPLVNQLHRRACASEIIENVDGEMSGINVDFTSFMSNTKLPYPYHQATFENASIMSRDVPALTKRTLSSLQVAFFLAASIPSKLISMETHSIL